MSDPCLLTAVEVAVVDVAKESPLATSPLEDARGVFGEPTQCVAFVALGGLGVAGLTAGVAEAVEFLVGP